MAVAGLVTPRAKAATQSGTLIVNSASTVGTITTGFAGLSFEKKTFDNTTFWSTSSTELMNLLKQIGAATGENTGYVRIGGNTADQFVYVGTETPGTNQFGNTAIDNLAEFLAETGWKCIYTINLGGSGNGTQTVARAVEEAAYVYDKLGSSLYGLCLGNEPDEWGDSGMYYAGNWSVTKYIALWKTYRAAILEKVPDVPMMAADCAGGWNTWTEEIGAALEGDLVMMTQHYYRDSGENAKDTAAYLVSADTTLTGAVLPDDMIASKSCTASGTRIPFRLSECNSFYEDSASGVADGYGAALWCVDFLFDLAKGGCTGANFHTNGTSEAGDFTPITVAVPYDKEGATVNSIHPEFYGMMFFSMVQPGDILESTLSISGSPNVTAYAVKLNNGNIPVMLVNKTSTPCSITMTMPGGITAASYLLMTQRSSGASTPSLTATSGVTIQGSTIGTSSDSFTTGSRTGLGHGGEDNTLVYDVPVPAYSATLVHVDY